MNDIANTIKALKVDDRSIGVKSKANSRLKLSDKLAIMLQFPLFSIANISHYVGSKLSAQCQPGCKDMFYELQKIPVIDGRSLLYILTRRMIRRAVQESSPDVNAVRCLIADDTDLPKRGKVIELVGRIYSHVVHLQRTCALHKDAKNQMPLPLHGEARQEIGLSELAFTINSGLFISDGIAVTSATGTTINVEQSIIKAQQLYPSKAGKNRITPYCSQISWRRSQGSRSTFGCCIPSGNN